MRNQMPCVLVRCATSLTDYEISIVGVVRDLNKVRTPVVITATFLAYIGFSAVLWDVDRHCITPPLWLLS